MIVRAFQQNGVRKFVAQSQIDRYRRDGISQEFSGFSMDFIFHFLGFRISGTKKARREDGPLILFQEV